MKKMKDSEIEWIGKIPSEWEIVRGGFLYSIFTGDLDVNQENPEGKYPFFTCSMTPKRIDSYKFDCEALLVAGNGIVGFTQYYNGKFNAYQRTYVLKDFKQVFPGFLKHYVSNNLKTDVTPKSQGSVIQFIKYNDLRDFHIVIPPYDQQVSIASYLDKKCDQIEGVIEAITKQIDSLERYKESVITKAVTQGLCSDIELCESGIEWIGKVPAHWKICRIADIYEDRNERGNEQLPLLTVSINSGVSDKELDDSEKDRVFLQSEDKTKYKRVYPGDLTYNMMRAWQGSMGAVRVEGMVSPAYVVAKPKENIKIDSRFIEALLRSPLGREEINRYSYGIMDFRKRLYWSQFRIIKIALPDYEEQRIISDYIDEKITEIDELIKIKTEQIKKIEEYKKTIIYEVVTGKKEVIQNN